MKGSSIKLKVRAKTGEGIFYQIESTCENWEELLESYSDADYAGDPHRFSLLRCKQDTDQVTLCTLKAATA